jgi:hypothetical protein
MKIKVFSRRPQSLRVFFRKNGLLERERDSTRMSTWEYAVCIMGNKKSCHACRYYLAKTVHAILSIGNWRHDTREKFMIFIVDVRLLLKERGSDISSLSSSFPLTLDLKIDSPIIFILHRSSTKYLWVNGGVICKMYVKDEMKKWRSWWGACHDFFIARKEIWNAKNAARENCLEDRQERGRQFF